MNVAGLKDRTFQRQQEKKLKDAMVNHKARAERRARYFKTKLADPSQLLRITGTTCKVYPDAQQYYQNEKQQNLIKWQGDAETLVDRFDVRGLIDFIPSLQPGQPDSNSHDEEIGEELEFERYRDLVEATRLQVEESHLLSNIDENWNDLLKRKPDKLQSTSAKKSKTIGYVYDSGRISESDSEREVNWIEEEDLINHLDEMPDSDVKKLNVMGKAFGIDNYFELMHEVKEEETVREEQEEAKLERRAVRGRKRTGTRTLNPRELNLAPLRRRSSPSYAPYSTDPMPADAYKASEDPVIEEPESIAEFITEFGNADEHVEGSVHDDSNSAYTRHLEHSRKTPTSSISTPSSRASSHDKTTTKAKTAKLTPLERLKAKAQQALQKQSQLSILQADEAKEDDKEASKLLQELDRSNNFSELQNHLGTSSGPSDNTTATKDEFGRDPREEIRGPKRSRSPSPSAK
ncbi:alternative splicing regulator-domain-containing protein [Phlyctochytrium arcticum]|nr:alternative splicing regulator-domain-containing protein [Phlyctochytrium arcticum]